VTLPVSVSVVTWFVLDRGAGEVVSGKGMAENGAAYRISVGHGGREVYADVAGFHVERWMAEHGASEAVTGTLRALVRRLLMERAMRQCREPAS